MAFNGRSATFFDIPAASHVGASSDTVSVPHIICDSIRTSGGTPIVVGGDLSVTNIVATGDISAATGNLAVVDVVATGAISATTGLSCLVAPVGANDVVRRTDVDYVLPMTTQLYNVPMWTVVDPIIPNIYVYDILPPADQYRLTRIGSYVYFDHLITWTWANAPNAIGTYHLMTSFPIDPTIPANFRPDTEFYASIPILISNVGLITGIVHIQPTGEFEIGATSTTSDLLNFVNVTHLQVKPFTVMWRCTV